MLKILILVEKAKIFIIFDDEHFFTQSMFACLLWFFARFVPKYLDASQESGTDMDLGTPPRPTRDTILTDYDNKNINGTQIQHVIGVVSVEEKAKDQGIENLSQTERRNLAKTKAAHVKAKLSNMDNFTEHINEQGERVMMYKPPHERSSAVAAAFTDEPEVTEVVPQPTANTPLDTLTSIRVSIHDKPPNSASRFVK